MKNSLKITAMAAILFFAASAISNAQYFRRTNNRMSYPSQCLDIPGLTDQQKVQITAINDAHTKVIDDMRAQFYAAEDITLANDIKAKMTVEQNNHLKKIGEVLNAEQLIYFNENIVAGPAGGRGSAYNRGGRGGRGYGYGYNGAPGRGRNNAARRPAGRGAGYGR